MPYSLPYVLFVLFLLVIGVVQLGIPLDQKSRRMLNGLVIIAYVCFFGFRGFIATDWINYFRFFKALPTSFSLGLKNSSFESGFVVYSILIKKISTSYLFFQLVNTITNLILLHIFFKRYLPDKYYTLGFTIFVVFGFLIEINLLRNSKSLLIFLLSLKYIEDRNWIKYYLMMSLALMFHWSSFIFLPLYFFLHKKIDVRIFIAIFVIGTLIYLFNIEYIKPVINYLSKWLPVESSENISGYLGSKVYGKAFGFGFGYFERTLTAIIIMLFYGKLINIKHSVIFINSFLIYIIIYLYFSEVYIAIVRIAYLFSYSYWILIPMLIMAIDKNFKIILYSLFGIFLLLKIHVSTNNIFFKYDNFLSSSVQPYKDRYEIYLKYKDTIDK